MILTPLFTPPDTAVGGERTTVPAGRGRRNGQRKVEFGFFQAGKMDHVCRECGIDWIEMAPLFAPSGGPVSKDRRWRNGRQRRSLRMRYPVPI